MDTLLLGKTLETSKIFGEGVLGHFKSVICVRRWPLNVFYSFFLSNSSIGKVKFSKIYIFQLHSSVVIATAFFLIFCYSIIFLLILQFFFLNVLEQSTGCHRVATRTQQWRLWKLCWGGWLFYDILVESNSILFYDCNRTIYITTL